MTAPLRSSVGPSPVVPFSREPKARREALAKQLPLHEGRKVAFRQPAGKNGDAAVAEADENTWILAVVTKCINQDKNRYALISYLFLKITFASYEVQDVEPQEDGQPGQ
jgi:SAGA-associated factor 29